MTELEKYQKVNSCETFEELQEAIKSFADVLGNIQGREKIFNAEEMAMKCGFYKVGFMPATVLTRNFGIRQRAIYLKNFENA